MRKTLLTFVLLLLSFTGFAQKIALYKQFYGSYDFTMMGNTMNVQANGDPNSCEILTASAANLNIAADKEIVAAYLYWSGNGAEQEADLNVKLNGVNVLSQRTYYKYLNAEKDAAHFSAFAEVTEILKSFGAGIYTLSDLDLRNHIARYCGVNYVGWSVVVVYSDKNIENNLVGIYDGFESLDENNPVINILLDGFRVTDAQNSKIAFLAWEGDESLSAGEQLLINAQIMSNGLNPANNAFNCTNSYSGSTQLWNMDLDLYDLSNHVKANDISLDIQMRTAADVVITNAIVLSVYSVFPDATTIVNSYKNYCNTRIIDVEYTVANYNGNHPLKSNMPVAFYIKGELVGTAQTTTEIAVGKDSKYTTRLTIPKKFGYRFDLEVSVDDEGDRKGIVYEIDEQNNTASSHIDLTRDCPVQKGISSNGDGLNDGFDLSVYDLNQLKIYNRYGVEVYKHGKGYSKQWIGQDKNGKELPVGTYFYIFNTDFETISGYIYLLREIE